MLISNIYVLKAAGFLNEGGVDISTSTALLYKRNRTATILTHNLVTLPNEDLISLEKKE